MRRLLFGLAVAAAAAGCGSTRTHAEPPVTLAQTVAVPRGFGAMTAAAVGTHDYWVLGDYRCRAGAFCLALIRSSDGGVHFTRVVAPLLPSHGTAPTLVFANARNGYAYTSDVSPLYVTHDGGVSWHRALAHSTIAVAVGGRMVYVVSGRCSHSHGCRRFRLLRSSASPTAWQALALPVQGGLPFSLAAHGSRLWLLGNGNDVAEHLDRLARSINNGRTFTVQSGPCSAGLGGRLTPAGHGVVWAVCPTGMLAGLWLSTDGGRSFRAVRSLHDAGGLRRPLTNGAEIVATSSRDAVLYGGAGGPLWHTSDAGLHWSRLAQTASFEQIFWLTFTTRRFGAAVVQSRGAGSHGELWRTTDGGETWRNVPLR